MNHAIAVAILCLLTSCREGRLQQVEICGQSCFPGDAEIGGAGECRLGIWSCEDGREPICKGWVGPRAETCDGLDNDCDGRVDQVLLRSCSSPCGIGKEICMDGAWEGCSAPVPAPEICNNLDDDCNGIIDDPVGLPVEFCYGGPPGTVVYGTCHPGSSRCVAGKKVCVGDQGPVAETCNGKDDDCDGKVDDNLDGGSGVDLFFIVDNSCSMAMAITNVKTATANWTNKYGTRPSIKFGLIAAPDISSAITTPTLVQNLTDPATFNVALATQNGVSGSGNEPTLDALMALASGNPLGLSWRPGVTRVAVMYSDEEPQSYAVQPVTQAMTTQALKNAGIRVHVFTDPTYGGSWASLASGTGGIYTTIYASPTAIEAELDKIINSAACQ